jgi:hypothetical protein
MKLFGSVAVAREISDFVVVIETVCLLAKEFVQGL